MTAHSSKANYAFVQAYIDDPSRPAYTAILPREGLHDAKEFLERPSRWEKSKQPPTLLALRVVASFSMNFDLRLS